MALTKTIEIDGKQVTFRASAAIPRIYRIKFKRDIFSDLNDLSGSIEKSNENASTIDIPSLEIFENIAFLMAKHADPQNVPETAEEWLDEFNTFSIYKILPEIIELWGENMDTQSSSKKK